MDTTFVLGRSKPALGARFPMQLFRVEGRGSDYLTQNQTLPPFEPTANGFKACRDTTAEYNPNSLATEAGTFGLGAGFVDLLWCLVLDVMIARSIGIDKKCAMHTPETSHSLKDHHLGVHPHSSSGKMSEHSRMVIIWGMAGARISKDVQRQKPQFCP
ncbi:hypothetical protein DSL72_007113 [Monilinia vaccinii-corymbosi]|uniref:Uncharacterized protein n=1 Tax=Monilinia vaccinii-corymbosi TaxID=61207 RepID=A0A8A3PM55_9HELO|nr:hypothetical protein DSL72_007113 [Monilinia vaccinii-corymbosi]